MVAVDLLPGLDVSVIANGKPLKEYEDRDEDIEGCSTMRYIEAVSGQVFEIAITAEQGCSSIGDCLMFEIHEDGSESKDEPLVFYQRCKDIAHRRVSRGIREGVNRVRLFRFAALEIASDGRMFKGEDLAVKDLGSIVIHISQRWAKACLETICRPGASSEDDGLKVVSEKALKGRSVTHSVDFTDAVTTPGETCWQTYPVQGIRAPHATVVFRYRSLETLKSMLLIPRTPTPPPLEDRDVDTLNMEELREIARRAKAARSQEANPKKIKREKISKTPRTRKVARPNKNSTQLVLDDDDKFR